MWTIKDLFDTINDYMYNKVDGDAFENEQDFEDAIRELLDENCFNVVSSRHTVANVEKLLSEGVGNVEDQIPDIVVSCDDGVVFIELKLRRSPEDYESDIKKVQNYIKQGKCDDGAVLFLDNVRRQGWTICQANKAYNYLF